MQKQWLEHFCKYRHICEFLGNEGKEKEEIKEYLMQESSLSEATTRYQMTRNQTWQKPKGETESYRDLKTERTMIQC